MAIQSPLPARVLRDPEPSLLTLSSWDARNRVLVQRAPTSLGHGVQPHLTDQRLTLRLHLPAVVLGESDVGDHGVWIRK